MSKKIRSENNMFETRFETGLQQIETGPQEEEGKTNGNEIERAVKERTKVVPAALFVKRQTLLGGINKQTKKKEKVTNLPISKGTSFRLFFGFKWQVAGFSLLSCVKRL